MVAQLLRLQLRAALLAQVRYCQKGGASRVCLRFAAVLELGRRVWDSDSCIFTSWGARVRSFRGSRYRGFFLGLLRMSGFLCDAGWVYGWHTSGQASGLTITKLPEVVLGAQSSGFLNVWLIHRFTLVFGIYGLNTGSFVIRMRCWDTF